MGVWNGPEDKRHKGGRGTGFQNNPWKDALNRALSGRGGKSKTTRNAELLKIAHEMIDCAQDRGSPHFQFAVKEIGLRLDGKPKESIELRTDEGVAALGVGISAAFAQLVKVSAGGEVIDGEVVVSDRPLLSAEVCVREGGCGESVDISALSGDTGKP